jgi:uncharacterized protein
LRGKVNANRATSAPRELPINALPLAHREQTSYTEILTLCLVQGEVCMFLNVRDLELRPQRFSQEFPPGAIDLLEERLRQHSVLRVEGKADYSTALQEIRIVGHLNVELASECDRCLEECRFLLDADFRLSYMPADANVAPEEAGLNDDEASVAFYEGDGLDLIEVFREQVVLGAPMHFLCQEDCKGLCPTCGENRNLSDCACPVAVVENPWTPLQALKSIK